LIWRNKGGRPSFSEEKEAKRLYAFARVGCRGKMNESFLVLFFKKERACFPGLF
jgi:hypothetical protein